MPIPHYNPGVFDSASGPDEEEESDDDMDADDYDEVQMEIIRRKTLEKHLPDIMKIMGQQPVDLVADKVEKSCAICTNLQWFKGWKALLAHADTFKKKKVYQHRGYADAIREALQSRSGSRSSDAGTSSTQTVPLGASVDRTIVWPPLLIIELRNREGRLSHAVRAFLDQFEKAFPDSQKPKYFRVSHCMGFLQYQDDYTGFLDAEILMQNCTKYSSEVLTYFPTTSNMNKIDPHREFVDWTEQTYHEKVAEPQVKAKEDYNQEQAKIRAVKVAIESVAEDEQNFKLKTTFFNNLIESRRAEIEKWKSRKEQIIRDSEKKVQSLQEKFERDMMISEARYKSRISRLQEQLHQTENRLEKTRNNRLAEIQNLQKQLQELTHDRKREEAQEALRKELQLMDKRKRFMDNLEKCLVEFNIKADEQESELLKKQHSEMTQLLEEADAEKKKLLQDWLEKQQSLKKSKEPVKEEVKESECAICLDTLTEDNRALLKPCGHARLCLECAISLYKERHGKRTCPICREHIVGKPALLPKKIFI